MTMAAAVSGPVVVQAEGDALRERWQALLAEQPRLRIRDAAARLGVSELQLLLSEPAEQVLRLDATPNRIFAGLPAVGRVMTLTRNETVVHETKGAIVDPQVSGAVGLCLGEIDLRLFFSHWQHAYAVRQSAGGGHDSLQFFDAAGGALHKIYALDDSDTAAWQALVARHGAAEQRPALSLASPRSPLVRRPPADARALLDDWAAMTDLHQFHGLLQRHEVDRLSALETAAPQWSRPVPVAAFEQALTLAAQREQPIMVFVGNPGVVQIYTGRVHRLMRTGPWFNVMDPHFNLHANTAAIAQCWIVRKPSDDGDVHSLEAFDADGELVVTLFGERKPGKPELPGWRSLLESLDA